MEKRIRIYCPVGDRLIDDAECFDVYMVIEEGAPSWSAPQDIINVPDFEKKCKQCKYYESD